MGGNKNPSTEQLN